MVADLIKYYNFLVIVCTSTMLKSTYICLVDGKNDQLRREHLIVLANLKW
jgi:hypothetical protein